MIRRRLRPRIEADLVRFDVHHIITDRPGARHHYIDRDGNKIHFDEVTIGRKFYLVVHVNERATPIRFQIVETPIRGCFSHLGMANYYVAEGSKRYKHIYLDRKTRKIGTRLGIKAVYTTDSISRKMVPAWRQLQKARRSKPWRWRKRAEL